jgi:anti-sigma factor RsiW
MSQNEIHNIDELLNSFLDGELDARHQTEVQRLIKHDEKIAQRLLELQTCKRLVNSLPYIEAPQELLGNIKASLQGKKLTAPSVPPMQRHREHKGARHLLLRRLTAAAAMIVLVGVLAAVIYSIVTPEVTITNKPVAVDLRLQPIAPQPKESAPAVSSDVAKAKPEVATAEKPAEITPFTGRLELKTNIPSEIAAFLNKALEYNIPSGERSAAIPDRSHVLACSRQNLKLLIDDLGTIWDKIDSATLFIDTDQPKGQIVVNAVAPEQIIEIAKQNDLQSQIKTAKFFAAMNNITERSPGKEVMIAIDNSAPALLTIPKPVLTSSEKPVTTAGAAKAEQKVLLTIVVVGSK